VSRKYSVQEIDQMRAAIDRGFYRPCDDMKAAALVEDRLRTHMLNGTEPNELERAADAFVAEWQKQLERRNTAGGAGAK
jgi:hypothetical protein